MIARKYNTAAYPVQFLMVDASDHVTAKTGLSPTASISKNGAAFAPSSGAVSELSNGIYSFAGNASDRDTLGELMIHIEATGADPVDIKVLIVKYDPFEDIYEVKAKTDNLPADPSSQSLVESALSSIPTVTPLTVEQIRTEMDMNSTQLAGIKAKTDNLPADPASQSLVEAALSSIPAATPPTVEEIRTEMDTNSVKLAKLDMSISSIPTINSVAVSSDDHTSPTTIEKIRGDDWTITFTNIDVDNIDKMWLTIKKRRNDPDTSAEVQIEKTAGLIRLKAAAGTPELATVTLNIPERSATFSISRTATADIYCGTMYYDLQIKPISGLVYTPSRGYYRVYEDITRSS